MSLWNTLRLLFLCRWRKQTESLGSRRQAQAVIISTFLPQQLEHSNDSQGICVFYSDDFLKSFHGNPRAYKNHQVSAFFSCPGGVWKRFEELQGSIVHGRIHRINRESRNMKKGWKRDEGRRRRIRSSIERTRRSGVWFYWNHGFCLVSLYFAAIMSFRARCVSLQVAEDSEQSGHWALSLPTWSGITSACRVSRLVPLRIVVSRSWTHEYQQRLA